MNFKKGIRQMDRTIKGEISRKESLYCLCGYPLFLGKRQYTIILYGSRMGNWI